MREVIRRSQMKPKECDHLQIVLDDNVSVPYLANEKHSVDFYGLFRAVLEKASEPHRLVAHKAVRMKRKAYLWLELSFEKNVDQYVCCQCGQTLSQSEYRLYKEIFEKARRNGSDIRRIKEAFACACAGKQKDYKGVITKGKQKYAQEISRMAAAGILAHEDERKRYEAAMERFR